ncbi:hypothetical protein [Klebsiella sp. BIGb0407]|uniref:hypothetical protein n=1 Tax=Klebsiella sp. BIGb0407 TaxID=2940603 RepID=UPI0038F6A2A4|nr:hypothetical protein [Klebsiella sp. BIGb0407]
MKLTWFQHPICTIEQADALQAQYRRRNITVSRSLNPDFSTWTISALLPESKNLPKADRRWRNRMWG